MSSTAFRKGDVFWAPDPFRQGSNPCLWLVLAGESLPYPDEEYICAALTTGGAAGPPRANGEAVSSDLPDNVEVGDEWVAGNDPSKTSYCSPRVLATVKHRAVANPQGEISDAFADRMIHAAKGYLGP